MKNQSWMIPAMVVAYVVVRIIISVRMRPKGGLSDRARIWVKFFWLLLAVCMVILLYWAPSHRRSQQPAPAPTPTPALQPPAQG